MEREKRAEDRMGGTDPAGLDKIGTDDAAQAPEDEKSIPLPIEDGDFDSQPG